MKGMPFTQLLTGTLATLAILAGCGTSEPTDLFSPDGVEVSGPHDVFDAENGVCTFLDR